MRAGLEGEEDAMRIKITMQQTSLPMCQRIISLRCLLSSALHNPTYSGSEIRETISFTTVSKRIKYLGMNLPKEVKDLCSVNYKTLTKETEDDTNRWKDIVSS